MNDIIFGKDKEKIFRLKEAQLVMQEPSYMESVDNRIYFYSEIDRSNILQLVRELRSLKNRHVSDVQTKEIPKENIVPIWLHIQSFGGGIYAGISGMDEIRKTTESVPVYTVIDGSCASAATFLSIVGTKRFINKNAFMMIHQLSSIAWGKYTEIQDVMENLERLMEFMKSIYNEYANIPEGELEGILDHDIWFDAEKCLEYGLVDEII